MTEADRTNELCRFCGLTKDSGTSGSITQYIRTCVCSLDKEEGNLEDIIDICLRCKKHIGKGRKGSFTQYIFRSELCDCPEPLSLVELEQETEDPSALSKKAGKSIEEAELDLDPAKFPLDRYIPLLELGRGASGRVYLARDRRLQKRVAIKVLTSSDQNQLLAFQEEAKNTSRLNNPYIVRILDFGIAGGSYPYMVLEYLQGISLEEYLKEHGPLAPDAATSIFVQLCLALEYAHEGRIFHRDLKPSNVILNGSTLEDCRVKLIDFGVAKTKHELMEPTIIQGRTVVGTPAYMSPDQVQGRAYDARSEIYSLGCLMFETLSGSVPYEGETALEILRKHAEEAPPDLSQCLDLNMSDLTEAHLAKLARALKLHILRISGTPVTSEMLNAIALNTELRVLFIRHATFGDQDLEKLLPLKQLTVLTLIESPHVTREGIASFRAKMKKPLRIEAKMGDSTNDFGFFMDVPEDLRH